MYLNPKEQSPQVFAIKTSDSGTQVLIWWAVDLIIADSHVHVQKGVVGIYTGSIIWEVGVRGSMTNI